MADSDFCIPNAPSLSALVDRAAKGEDIVITKEGGPRIRLVPIPAPRRRRSGLWRGKLEVPENFDDPLPEALLKAFEGGDE